MKKSKLFLSVLSLCFSFAVLLFGVYAAGQVNYNISGSISYIVDDCYVDIRTRVYSSNQLLKVNEIYDQIDKILLDDESSYEDLSAENISNLNFNSLSDLLTDLPKSCNLNFASGKYVYFVVMTVSNLSADVNVYANAKC